MHNSTSLGASLHLVKPLTKHIMLFFLQQRVTVFFSFLRGLAVVVHYAVVLEGDGAGISNETMDYINLHSNMVENSFTDPDELPTVVHTITDFRNYITEALHKENFIRNTTLDVDPDSLQLENGKTFSKKLRQIVDSL